VLNDDHEHPVWGLEGSLCGLTASGKMQCYTAVRVFFADLQEWGVIPPRFGPVVHQNFSRGPKRGGSGGVGVNTIIDSVQQEDPKRASPVARGATYIKDRPKVDPYYAARL
jgi:hypothetical protein